MNGEATKPQGQPFAALTYLLLFVTGILLLYIEPYSKDCLLYTSPSPRDLSTSRMPSSA